MGTPIRVLIVEDSVNDTLLLADELRGNGYDPDWLRAETPESMSAALREQTWDVIIADFKMPRFSGPEALKVLQESGLDIPFILVSGAAPEDIGVDVMRSGAQDFILKHSLSRLAPAVTRELAEAETRRERKHAEENVARLAMIVESSQDAIVGNTPEGIITSWNRGAALMYGYSSEEALGQPFSIIIPPDRVEESKVLRDRACRGEAISLFETERVTKSGDRLYVSTSISPIRDQEGRIVGVSTIARDITQLKLAEQREREVEAHKREFYRRTILAATDGKLLICEKEEIDSVTGSLLGAWDVASKADLRAVRGDVSRIAREEGMDEPRVLDLLGCIVEAAANAIKHANGGCASLHRNTDSLLFTISDSGPGIGALALPDVALAKGYSTAGTLGMGYKLMIAYADKVYLATGPTGTIVAAEMRIHPEKPSEGVLSELPGW